ncbi:MAG: ATP-dependent RNA helicase HrpA [Pseudomonadota bacterium]|nr:ATP-dependent RNA helicase HrpA [Pseudomonadota bacterium]
MAVDLNFPLALPITAKRAVIAESIRENPVTVISGETGSGKSTQLPKICIEAGRGQSGLIGHTQPRRIAARSVASRIAVELGVTLGSTVGYRVRFDEQLSEHTVVKVMTDGMLLAELENDHRLRDYDTLIIDEAHERSLNIDFLLGYLRQFLPSRPDFRVMITSATLETEKFCEHFSQAPLIHVSGRNYPVEIRYQPIDEGGGEDALSIAMRQAVDELVREGPGDVLLFLPGEREIREAHEDLTTSFGDTFELLPLYARLPAADQQRIFTSHRRPRIVLATNVAETSLTVPGVRYVIDTGLARVSRYNAASKVQRLPIEAIARDSADQRAGRCGRQSAGVCIRLYSEADYLARPAYTDPEIKRSSLAAVALRLSSMRLGRINRFPFVDPPERRQVAAGYRLLRELDAIDRNDQLTAVGRELARVPVDPRLGRILLAAAERNCLAEALVIAAALEGNDPRVVPHDDQEKARLHHRRYPPAESDFLALLGIWTDYTAQVQSVSRRQLRRWCTTRYLSTVRMREWYDLHQQLTRVMHERGYTINKARATKVDLHKALLTGLLGNVARRDEEGFYRGTRNRIVTIWPASRLARTKARWVMAAELTETTRLFARHVAEIEPEWIDEVAAHQVRYSHSEPYWSSREECVMAFESVSLWGLPVVVRRRINYALVRPRDARALFIREGLIQDVLNGTAGFLNHNRLLLQRLRDEEAKTRQPGSRVDQERIATFYEARLPEQVSSTATLDAWYCGASTADQKSLLMKRTDIAGETTPPDQTSFPDLLKIGESTLRLRYCYEPGEDKDGVSLEVPLYLINQLNPARLDRMVPGLLADKMMVLLKTLPRGLRRHLVPLPEFVEKSLPMIRQDQRRLTVALAKSATKQSGVTINEQDFNVNGLPRYLCMHVEVLDESGEVRAHGDDVATLQASLGSEGGKHFDSRIAASIERSSIQSWDFGPLPKKVPGKIGSARVTAYPGLTAESGKVGIRLYESPQQALVAHRAGLHQLLLLHLPAQRRLLRRIPGIDRAGLQFATIGTCEALQRDVVGAVLDRVFDSSPDKVRNEDEFLELVARCKHRIAPELEAVMSVLEMILRQFNKSRLRLANAENLAATIRQDISRQLSRLVTSGFVCATPVQWFECLPRFLRAVEVRLDKAVSDPEQDLSRWQRLAPFVSRVDSLSAGAVTSLAAFDYYWLVEEYRVSVFAQQLKTSRPVSPERLEKEWQRLVNQSVAL